MKNSLIRYSDTDWAGNRKDQKSTLGFIFLLYSRAISWASKKQMFIALSIIEAKYVVLSNASKDAC